MSPELKQFYRELQAWIDGGCPRHECFRPYRGICGSLMIYATLNFPGKSGYLSAELQEEMKSSLKETLVPFNRPEDGMPSYGAEFSESTTYKNPKRLAWIKEHAQ